MADAKEMKYRTRGSGAVAPSYNPYWGNTVPKTPGGAEPQNPDHELHPRLEPKKQKLTISPFAVVGVCVCMIMLLLVLFGYSQVYETASLVGEMEDVIEDLTAENVKLQNRYDTSIDLQHVEERARELGMQQPTARQIVTLQVPVEDSTVVVQKAADNPIQAAWEAVSDTARGLWAYLHGAQNRI